MTVCSATLTSHGKTGDVQTKQEVENAKLMLRNICFMSLIQQLYQVFDKNSRVEIGCKSSF